MKKLLTLRNVILCAAFIVVLVTFILSFTATFTCDFPHRNYHNIIWGTNKSSSEGYVYIFEKAYPAAALLLVGTILMIVGAVAAVVVSLFVKKPWAKWIVIGLAAIIVTGAIFQFFTLESFARVQLIDETIEMPVSPQEFAQMLKTRMQAYKEMGWYCNETTANGILGIIAGLVVAATPFVPNKGLLK